MPRGPDRDRLARDLRALGLRRGGHLLIHSSLRQVATGPATVLDALRLATGPQATLVVPTQTTMNSPTSLAFRTATSGLDAERLARFVAELPGFDPATTPSNGMGALAEHIRTRPRASRSRHPLTSFAALGPHAAAITSVHDLECHLGERSPLGRLYAADASVLLLGVGYEVCTAFHLAEYRLSPATRRYRCFVAEDGVRKDLEFTGIVLDDDDFGALGADLDPLPFVRRGRVGAANCRLFPLRAAVDFAAGWFRTNRNQMIA